jgi:hypothetical protein
LHIITDKIPYSHHSFSRQLLFDSRSPMFFLSIYSSLMLA